MNTLLLKIIENIVEELENKQDKTIQDIELINEQSVPLPPTWEGEKYTTSENIYPIYGYGLNEPDADDNIPVFVSEWDGRANIIGNDDHNTTISGSVIRVGTTGITYYNSAKRAIFNQHSNSAILSGGVIIWNGAITASGAVRPAIRPEPAPASAALPRSMSCPVTA